MKKCVSLYLFQNREIVQRAYKTSWIDWRTHITRDGSQLHPSHYWITVIGPCFAYSKSASQMRVTVMIVSELAFCFYICVTVEY